MVFMITIYGSEEYDLEGCRIAFNVQGRGNSEIQDSMTCPISKSPISINAPDTNLKQPSRRRRHPSNNKTLQKGRAAELAEQI